MKLVLAVLVVLCAMGCSRGFLEHKSTYYDYSEAYDMCFRLKSGVLIVQVPSEGKKHRLMKAQFENEEKPKKKLKLEEAYNKEINELKQAQRSLVNGFPAYYTFSNVAFIPDSLVHDFQSGKRTEVFLDQDLKLTTDESIDTSQYIMYVRSLRDFDHLYIYTSENKLPPDPFPYSSTVSTGNINIMKKSEKVNPIENHRIYIAIVTLNRKLNKLYTSTKMGF